ncbi:MAG TPA: ABC transporter permease subunit [Thermohalobaculum sp.]|nr:ABC transporter permease subunit [Thermohalobaculum sp.]
MTQAPTQAPTRAGRLSPGLDIDRAVPAMLAVLVAVPLLVFVLFPLSSILIMSFSTPDGLGLGNYVRYLEEPKFVQIVRNSLSVASCATAITIVLAYGFAYAMNRSAMPLKGAFRLIALMPLFAPSLVQALGVLFLLGRNGLINRTFDLGIDIYGFWGIVISDVFYSFPHAFLILSAALAVGDARHYESARMLGATGRRIFFTVTLPSTKYGLMSAIFVVFTIVITDFGNPMVIGGDYSVLATEIYNQVSGQANFEMGAVIGMILLVPAALAVLVERWVARRSFSVIGDRYQPLAIGRSRRFDALMLGYASLVCGGILAVVGIVVFASFATLWPYNMSPSLKHYEFDVQNGLQPLWTSIWVSLMAAVIGIFFVLIGAYVVHKYRNWFTRCLYFLSILPAAVPGMVLGLGYILAFNDPANPVYLIYGTLLILAICNVYHYHAQGFLIATTSVKQISDTLDEASTSLGASFLRTMRRVTLPIIWPSVVSVGVFFFVRSMVTLSAVIFLISPSTQLAAVSVLLLDDAGNQNQAAAFSVCIMLVVAAALILFQLVLRLFGAPAVSLMK